MQGFKNKRMKNEKFLIPLVLELNEDLSPEERLIGIRTIGLKENGKSIIGHVAMIKDFSGVNVVRNGNLKVTEYRKKKLGKFAI